MAAIPERAAGDSHLCHRAWCGYEQADEFHRAPLPKTGSANAAGGAGGHRPGAVQWAFES